MASPLPMKRPVPIAPPRPIMTICVLERPRCRPLSRSLIETGFMRPLQLVGVSWSDDSHRAPGAARSDDRAAPETASSGRNLSELARDAQPDRAGPHGEQRVRVLARVDGGDSRALVRHVAGEHGE